MPSDAAFTIGQGKNEYYLHLLILNAHIAKILNKRRICSLMILKFMSFCFPLDFHQNAQAMSRYILSQKSNDARAKAMHDIANKKEDYKSLKLSPSEELKLKGTDF